RRRAVDGRLRQRLGPQPRRVWIESQDELRFTGAHTRGQPVPEGHLRPGEDAADELRLRHGVGLLGIDNGHARR
ncbi:MAG: hypothetical protein H0T43_12790, partial [Solirubrobacterales bacterium]|nr:hypothetical protein [Solirubrobacterales bacterium]